MTNITKNNTSKDVQLHIDMARKIIDIYLPYNYAAEVLAKMQNERPVTENMIRNVKKRLSDRLDILNAMVEVALEHKAQIEKLKELTT